MNLGKAIRLKRLIEPQYSSCIIRALDHGMTSPDFLDSLYASLQEPFRKAAKR